MKPKQTKEKADAAFIEKIKSIGIIVKGSSKPGEVCPKCNESMDSHIAGIAIPLTKSMVSALVGAIDKVRPESVHVKPAADETAFAA